MPGGLLILTVTGVISVAILVWFLIKKFGEDTISEMLKKRREGAVVSQAGYYVEGRERVPVAMTLTKKSLFYENADLQAVLDLERLDEVEYDSELSTSASEIRGSVLRLRSHGQTFEFIVSVGKETEWKEHLPAHRMDEEGDVHAV